MALFHKKADPISARSRQLAAEIGALELQIQQLNRRIEHANTHPRIRSSAAPVGMPVRSPALPAVDAPLKETVFEQINFIPTRSGGEPADGAGEQFNELGIRKYNLLGALRRLRHVVGGRPAPNPKLVSYLAAGSIKGLRPLRYEKRVARNRFLFLSMLFLFILWGIAEAVFRGT